VVADVLDSTGFGLAVRIVTREGALVGDDLSVIRVVGVGIVGPDLGAAQGGRRSILVTILIASSNVPVRVRNCAIGCIWKPDVEEKF
jgi:hypothetical protein